MRMLVVFLYPPGGYEPDRPDRWVTVERGPTRKVVTYPTRVAAELHISKKYPGLTWSPALLSDVDFLGAWA